MRPRITIVRRHIETLRVALISSSLEEIEGCLSQLDEAIRCLASVGQASLGHASAGQASVGHDLRTPPRDLTEESRVEIEALQKELHLVTCLIHNGAMLNEGWARLLGASVAGYVRTGEAAPLTSLIETPGGVSAGRISLQG